MAFMGWFGPRGLASVVFTLLALEEFEHRGRRCGARADGNLDHPAVRLLHGITASPLSHRYGASIGKAGDVRENGPASEPRIRLRDLAGRRIPSGPFKN